MLHNHHIFKFYSHAEKKLFIITALRTGSSFCEKYFTTDKGWLQEDQFAIFDVTRLQNLLDQEWSFYSLTKNPWLRLASSLDMIIDPPDREDSVDTCIKVFHAGMKMAYRKSNTSARTYGFGEYLLHDSHLGWSTHVMGLFLESVGIRVEPLIMPTSYRHDVNTQLGLKDLNQFLETLEDPDINVYIKDWRQKSTLAYEHRFQRAHDYLNLCNQISNFDGTITLPTYTVYDWMGHDMQMYHTFLNMEKQDSAVARINLARQTLDRIIKEIGTKVDFRAIQTRTEYEFPTNTMWQMLWGFHEYRSMIPELYEFTQIAPFDGERKMHRIDRTDHALFNINVISPEEVHTCP